MPTPEQRPTTPATEALIRAYRVAWKRIEAWMGELADDPRNATKRARMAAQMRAIEVDMIRLDSAATRWLRNQVPREYADGAVAAARAIGRNDFTWNQAHQDAVRLLTDRGYRNLLDATNTVNKSTKRLIRQIGRDTALQAAIGGDTAQAAGREMRRVLERSGVHAVTYSNGARHGLASYTEMAMRTLTGHAYNEGTIRSSVERGVQWFEVFDGSGCGWSKHDDTDKAHGKVVTYEESLAHPLAHPNCRRGFGPRPDIDRPVPGKPPDGAESSNVGTAEKGARR